MALSLLILPTLGPEPYKWYLHGASGLGFRTVGSSVCELGFRVLGLWGQHAPWTCETCECASVEPTPITPAGQKTQYLEVRCTYNLLRDSTYNPVINPITTVTLDIIGL